MTRPNSGRAIELALTEVVGFIASVFWTVRAAIINPARFAAFSRTRRAAPPLAFVLVGGALLAWVFFRPSASGIDTLIPDSSESISLPQAAVHTVPFFLTAGLLAFFLSWLVARRVSLGSAIVTLQLHVTGMLLWLLVARHLVLVALSPIAPLRVRFAIAFALVIAAVGFASAISVEAIDPYARNLPTGRRRVTQLVAVLAPTFSVVVWIFLFDQVIGSSRTTIPGMPIFRVQYRFDQAAHGTAVFYLRNEEGPSFTVAKDGTHSLRVDGVHHPIGLRCSASGEDCRFRRGAQQWLAITPTDGTIDWGNATDIRLEFEIRDEPYPLVVQCRWKGGPKICSGSRVLPPSNCARPGSNCGSSVY